MGQGMWCTDPLSTLVEALWLHDMLRHTQGRLILRPKVVLSITLYCMSCQPAGRHMRRCEHLPVARTRHGKLDTTMEQWQLGGMPPQQCLSCGGSSECGIQML